MIVFTPQATTKLAVHEGTLKTWEPNNKFICNCCGGYMRECGTSTQTWGCITCDYITTDIKAHFREVIEHF